MLADSELRDEAHATVAERASDLASRPFRYDADVQLTIDGRGLRGLADEFGTPLYVYSADQIRRRLGLFEAAFSRVAHVVCYAVKANSSLAILQMLGGMGAGFDIVSGGELERIQRACPEALARVVFSGVGKQAWEMDAALRAGILMFNVESPAELELLAERAKLLGVVARFALRVNPDVLAETHPYISTGLREHKFGVAMDEARALYRRAAQHSGLEATGVSVHIGSQIRAVSPFAEALRRVALLVGQLRGDGHMITHVDAGGGLGIDYLASMGMPTAGLPEEAASVAIGETPETQVRRYAEALLPVIEDLRCTLVLEPGRFLVAPAGGLLSTVLSEKRNGAKRFVITDAAMNDLIRPALYQAYHEIVAVDGRSLRDRMPTRAEDGPGGDVRIADVVGPVCESGDFFAQDRELAPQQAGDLLLLADAGAYGMSQSSNYNTRVRPAEVLVDGGVARLIRRRETIDDLLAAERLL